MELHFKQFGSGEPLLILHGLLGSLDNWQSLAKQYAEQFTVFAIDMRNHGKSPHSDAFSYALMTQDIVDFCEQHHIYKTHVLGHSMGGKVAMEFALDHSDYVDKLIIADIAPVKYKPGHNEIFEALFRVDLKKINERSEAEAILAETIQSYSVRQFLMKGLTRNEDLSFEWKFNLDTLWNHYPEILEAYNGNSTFNGKSLFLRGEHSDYVLPEYEAKIFRLFPQAKIETIHKAGHWMHAENPQEFFEKSIRFLLN